VYNSLSAVSLSDLFFWNQLTALSEGCLYTYDMISHSDSMFLIQRLQCPKRGRESNFSFNILLCYPVNKEVSWMRSSFVSMGSGEVMKGTLKNLAIRGTLH
jgi:hypothetical protein